MKFEGFEGIDVNEMERQRYKQIKDSKKYLELNILIGADDEEDLGKGLVGKMPVVSTALRNCGSKEVGCLYMTLKSYLDHMEQEYPAECFTAKLAMKVSEVGHTELSIKHDEED